ncbi:LacI family DNA-binding transcriptional regulator [Vannielia litorea]|uniref:LacI family DNA-binding transcriptional regulator n=1 Tax=Vannielia litorea TaxID=1217970 RepID=UPI001C96505C|nr:LacI family DNA-binding transcriptional regulator [Vannielia litorea]MBY6046206.1 LacI family DNA-binding transcriptional regulator [Vannielia litorea]MBY6073619.1 LacI family DNA-binding transcriptional regulator [Vannielia litorea]
MKTRPTIPDLASAAGVSVSTVNRVISDAGSVRQPTRERVLEAAQEIGFYGLGTIEHSVRSRRETHRLGVILQARSRVFYRDLGAALEAAARSHPDANVELVIDHLDDLSPDNVAARIRRLGQSCETVAVVSAEHPLVSEAIDEVLAGGTPVCGLIGPLSARGNVGYIGLDNWKVGRTAAWAFHRMCREPGKIGILVGNHRYRNQELNETGFRSYFREHDAGFTVLEPQNTYESAAVARELTEKLFHDHPDLCGLYISGGGVTGALAAAREAKRREDFIGVGYEMIEPTRAALIDGTLAMVIAHPFEPFARQTVATMIKAKLAGPDAGAQRVTLGFDIFTSENI